MYLYKLKKIEKRVAAGLLPYMPVVGEGGWEIKVPVFLHSKNFVYYTRQNNEKYNIYFADVFRFRGKIDKKIFFFQ